MRPGLPEGIRGDDWLGGSACDIRAPWSRQHVREAPRCREAARGGGIVRVCRDGRPATGRTGCRIVPGSEGGCLLLWFSHPCGGKLDVRPAGIGVFGPGVRRTARHCPCHGRTDGRGRQRQGRIGGPAGGRRTERPRRATVEAHLAGRRSGRRFGSLPRRRIGRCRTGPLRRRLQGDRPGLRSNDRRRSRHRTRISRGTCGCDFGDGRAQAFVARYLRRGLDLSGCLQPSTPGAGGRAGRWRNALTRNRGLPRRHRAHR